MLQRVTLLLLLLLLFLKLLLLFVSPLLRDPLFRRWTEREESVGGRVDLRPGRVAAHGGWERQRGGHSRTTAGGSVLCVYKYNPGLISIDHCQLSELTKYSQDTT